MVIGEKCEVEGGCVEAVAGDEEKLVTEDNQ